MSTEKKEWFKRYEHLNLVSLRNRDVARARLEKQIQDAREVITQQMAQIEALLDCLNDIQTACDETVLLEYLLVKHPEQARQMMTEAVSVKIKLGGNT